MQKAKQNEISKNIVICFSLSKPIMRYQFHLQAFFSPSFLFQSREEKDSCILMKTKINT